MKVLFRIARLFRNIVFLGWLVAALALTSISATIWATTLAARTTALATTAAANAASHRKEIARMTSQSTRKLREITSRNARKLADMTAAHKARFANITANHKAAMRKALLKAKARARIRRYVIAVPFLGAAAVAYFEKKDYDEWKEENPNGTEQEYLCLIYTDSKDVVAEVQADANVFLHSAYDGLPGWVPGFIKIELPDLNSLLPTCDQPIPAEALSQAPNRNP